MSCLEAQHLVPLVVLQPRIHFDSAHVPQCPQSRLELLGLSFLDFLDDLVTDLVLAALSVAAILGIGL